MGLRFGMGVDAESKEAEPNEAHEVVYELSQLDYPIHTSDYRFSPLQTTPVNDFLNPWGIQILFFSAETFSPTSATNLSIGSTN
jgi:hypothetical protein